MKSISLTKSTRLLIPTILLLWCFNLQAQDDENRILHGWLKYSDAENALFHYLTDLANGYLNQRKADISELHSRADWRNRQQDLHRRFKSTIGIFPARTALNARTVARIEKQNYIFEKVIYESQPGFYVTAGFYLPKQRQKPAPAVIYCSGHTSLGFRSDTCQRVILNLTARGCIVFAFDPIGQGERLQFIAPGDSTSRVGGATTEHSYAGAQSFLIGESIAKHMIWDGIRAIDYLETRPEVDTARIGITGRSG